MNMILYKSNHCPFLLHYPLSSHAVVTRTMKISRIYLLFDTRYLVWFLCSGWQVVVLYATPTRALMLVKKLQSWRVVAPFQGRWEELLKNCWPCHFWIWYRQPSCWVPNFTFTWIPGDVGSLLTAGFLVWKEGVQLIRVKMWACERGNFN